jgi:hypothetical protein
MPVTIGLITAGAGLIGGTISRAKSNAEMRRQMANRPLYQADEYTKQRLGLAQAQLNARMAGASQAERNIMSQQASTLGNVQRASTDASQALLAAGNVQAQTNKALENLGLAEAQNYQTRLGNLVGAQEAMAQEKAKEFEWNQAGKWQDMNSMQAAIAQNRANTFRDITSAGTQVAELGLNGAFGKTTPPTTPTTPTTQTTTPTQQMLWGTGGGLTNAPVLGGITPSSIQGFNAIGMQPYGRIATQPTTEFNLDNIGLYGGFRTR